MSLTTYPTGLAFAEARECLCALGSARRLGVERVTLDAAFGRCLATPIHAPHDVPPFANSAMDGYALRDADLPATGERGFRLVGRRVAGDTRPLVIGPGECAGITTGAVLPQGTDSVVIKENVRLDGQTVFVRAGEPAGANVRPAGEDYRAGEPAFAAGMRLTPARVGVLASFGLTEIEVSRQPRVAVLTTGDELVPPGQMLQPGQIHDSNRYGLAGLLRRHGVARLAQIRVTDDPQALEASLLAASRTHDLIVTSGGVSAGEADFLPSVVERLGHLHFWKVRMRPGMPVLAGEIGAALLVGLPGNPVSSLTVFLTLVRPLLDAMQGATEMPPRQYARLAVPIHKTHRRAEFQRGRLESRPDGSRWTTPFPRQGSGILRSMAEADCLIVLDEAVERLAADSVVEVLPFAGTD